MTNFSELGERPFVLCFKGCESWVHGIDIELGSGHLLIVGGSVALELRGANPLSTKRSRGWQKVNVLDERCLADWIL